MEKAYETGMDTVTQILQENGYHNHNINVTIQKNPSQNGPQPSKNWPPKIKMGTIHIAKQKLP